jgi:hypothetical protein
MHGIKGEFPLTFGSFDTLEKLGIPDGQPDLIGKRLEAVGVRLCKKSASVFVDV